VTRSFVSMLVRGIIACMAVFVAASSLPGLAPVAHAQQPEAPTLSGIEVRGNLRVEEEAIRRQIQLSPGDAITHRALGESVRNVYDLGYFDDIVVELERAGDDWILRYVVTEKPAIARIEIQGNDALDNDEIEEAMTLRIGSILDENAVRRAERSIVDAYREKGFYLVEVEATIVDIAPGEVEVRYDIREDERVRVARVSFVGNESLSDSQLQQVLYTRPRGWFGFLGQMGNFQPEQLRLDAQRIAFYYYDFGFLDVEVGDPVVQLGRDGQSIYVTIPVDEGEPYTVRSIDLTGDFLVPQDELLEMTRLDLDTFVSSTVRGDIERLTSFYRDAGFCNANVNLLTNQDPDTLTIDVTYDIQQGEVCYIGRIEFVGNTITRDLVMRREMRIEEGDEYDGTALRTSEARIRRLGHFENVTVREQPQARDPRIVDIEIEVTERPTRSLQIGAGFSSADSFIATAQISESNLFGRGQSLTLNTQLSRTRTLFLLQFFEPWLFNRRVSLNATLSQQSLLFPQFERNSRAAGITFGVRPFWRHSFWADLSFQMGYLIETTDVREGGFSGSTGSVNLLTSGGLSSSLTGGVYLDRRNDRLFPSDGSWLGVNTQVADAAWGSENEFVRVEGFARAYRGLDFLDCGNDDRFAEVRQGVSGSMCRWVSQWVARANAEIGWVGSTSTTRDVPLYERFFVGGSEDVRGFQRYSLSPTTPTARTDDPFASTGDALTGGYKQLFLNLELEYPLVTALGLRGVFFIDAGNAFDRDQPYTLRLDVLDGPDGNVLRTSAGFGIRWRSPIGPLRFEWGYPLARDRTGDDAEDRRVFEFSISNAF